jgi:hypothetical protein
MELNHGSAIPPEQPYDYVICPVCNLPVRKSMVGKGGHLAVKHKMTVKECRAAYPGAILYSPRRLALESARRKARPELVRARSKRWRDKNPYKANLNTRNWEAKNPEKAKAHKRRSAANYAPKRRAKWEARTPEQIEEDNRKQRESYARRYPNRSPEKVEKDTERSRVKYRATQAKLAKADRLKNVEGLDLKTGLRVSLAAGLLAEGATPYLMRDEVYPDAKDPLDSIKKLLSNRAAPIDAEKLRFAGLPEDQRRAEIEDLRVRLHRELD